MAVLVFAGFEELSQGFVATRSLDLTDFLADLVGIALATMAAPPLHRLLLSDGQAPIGVPDSEP